MNSPRTIERGAPHGRARGIRLALVGALLASIAACGSEAGPTPSTPAGGAPHNIIIVLVDTLRADHLGCYGYDLPTSPEIDAFAATSTLFENNTSQSNSTSPSTLSILTGVYPRTHRNYFAVPLEGTFNDRSDLSNVAQRLALLDYRTHSIWSHPLWQRRPGGGTFDRGWESFVTLPQDRSYRDRIALGDARLITDGALELIDDWRAQPDDGPLLLLAHYFDPHTPYAPPEEDLDRFLGAHLEAVGMEHLEQELRGVAHERKSRLFTNKAERTLGGLALGRARYDEEIRDVSREVGRLFDQLRQRDLFDDALIVFLADHGENMEGDEAGRLSVRFSHERLFQGVIGTPLIVKLPGQRKGQRISALTQNIDVLPTLLDSLDLPAEPPMDGTSLLPLIRGEVASVHEHVFSESSDQLEKSVRTKKLKLIQITPEAVPEIFRLQRDALEHVNIAGSLSSERIEALLGKLDAFRPESWLAISLTPAAEPYDATIDVRLLGGQITDVRGDGWVIDPDGRAATWQGRVEDVQIDACVRLSRSLPGAEIRIRSAGDRPIIERVRLGATPLAISDVFALPPSGDDVAGGPKGGPSPKGGQVSLSTAARTNRACA